MAETIEVELRYKVADPQAMVARLGEAAIKVVSKKHVIDQWFAPTSVRTMEQEEDWFDNNHGVAWRIRRVEQADGSMHTTLDSKQLTEDNNHNTFIESEPETIEYDEAVARLQVQDYRCWLTIDKTRTTFDSNDPHIEIVMDEIAGMGEKIGIPAGLELEFKGEGTREEALHTLAAFALSLGLDESQQFERSFTVESMQALADFEG